MLSCGAVGFPRDASPPRKLQLQIVSPRVGDAYLAAEGIWIAIAPTPGTVTVKVGGVAIGTITGAPWGLVWYPGVAGAYTVEVSGPGKLPASIAVTVNAESALDPSALAYVKGYWTPTSGVSLDGSNRVQSWTPAGALTWVASLAQATAANRPYMGTMRGRAVLRQTAAAQRLTGATLLALNQIWHMMGVGRSTIGANTAYLMGTSTNMRIEQSPGAGPVVLWPRTISGFANLSLNGPSYPRSAPHLHTAKANGASGRVDLDTTAGAVGTIGTGILASGATYAFPGSSSGASGFVGAVGDGLVLQGATDAQRDALQAHLVSKYRLAQPSRAVTWIGDSNGRGFGASSIASCYRALVAQSWQSYRLGGFWGDSIGIFEDVNFLDDLHCCSDGKGVDWVALNVTPYLGAGAAKLPCDVVVYAIGTNDVRDVSAPWVAGTGPGSTWDRWVANVTAIRAALPGATIVLATLPAINDPTYQARATWFNAQIAAYQAVTAGTALADYAAWVGAWSGTHFGDAVHLNDAGHALVASNLIGLFSRL